jgi:hypothetical protein
VAAAAAAASFDLLHASLGKKAAQQSTGVGVYWLQYTALQMPMLCQVLPCPASRWQASVTPHNSVLWVKHGTHSKLAMPIPS